MHKAVENETLKKFTQGDGLGKSEQIAHAMIWYVWKMINLQKNKLQIDVCFSVDGDIYYMLVLEFPAKLDTECHLGGGPPKQQKFRVIPWWAGWIAFNIAVLL